MALAASASAAIAKRTRVIAMTILWSRGRGRSTMVLTKPELIALLQKEVRLLLHLTTKIDQDSLDYRPSPKQRSTLELLRYLTTMGPALIQYAKGQPMDAEQIAEATAAANKRTFEQTV